MEVWLATRTVPAGGSEMRSFRVSSAVGRLRLSTRLAFTVRHEIQGRSALSKVRSCGEGFVIVKQRVLGGFCAGCTWTAIEWSGDSAETSAATTLAARMAARTPMAKTIL